jgi:predicted ATPase
MRRITGVLKDKETPGVVIVITGGRGAGKGAMYDAVMERAGDAGYTVLASNVEKKDAKLKPSTAGDSALDTAETNDYDR